MATETSDAQRVMNMLMTEKQLQDNVIELAKRLGYLTFHTYDSRRSEPGFPDLVLVGKRRVIFIELKRQTGKLRREQQDWREALERTSLYGRHDYYLWRPSDWTSGDTEWVLKQEAA